MQILEKKETNICISTPNKSFQRSDKNSRRMEKSCWNVEKRVSLLVSTQRRIFSYDIRDMMSVEVESRRSVQCFLFCLLFFLVCGERKKREKES